MEITQAVPAKDTSKAREAAKAVFAKRRAEKAIAELVSQGYSVMTFSPEDVVISGCPCQHDR